MERHKEEALTSGCSPELMKNAKFQPNTGTDPGPGEQQALWNDTEVPTLCSYQWEGNELGRVGASAMQTLCPLPGRQSGLGNFFPAIRVEKGFTHLFLLPAEMTRSVAGAAWPGLVSPEARRGLEAGLGTVLLGVTPGGNQGEGIAPVLSFPILAPVREQWWGSACSMDNPWSCIQPWLVPSTSSSGASALQKLLIPLLKQTEEQRQCTAGSRERAPLSCF